VEELGFIGRGYATRLLSQCQCGLATLHPVPRYVVAQPAKVFEYMAASIPVIASDFPILRDIVEEAGWGILVNPLDAK
jgi:glycosyltransferase involved in cell wall biosynthesis